MYGRIYYSFFKRFYSHSTKLITPSLLFEPSAENLQDNNQVRQSVSWGILYLTAFEDSLLYFTTFPVLYGKAGLFCAHILFLLLVYLYITRRISSSKSTRSVTAARQTPQRTR